MLPLYTEIIERGGYAGAPVGFTRVLSESAGSYHQNDVFHKTGAFANPHVFGAIIGNFLRDAYAAQGFRIERVRVAIEPRRLSYYRGHTFHVHVRPERDDYPSTTIRALLDDISLLNMGDFGKESVMGLLERQIRQEIQ